MRKKKAGFLRWLLLVPQEHCQKKLWEEWGLVSKQDHRENGRSQLFYKMPNPSTYLVDFQTYLGVSSSEHMLFPFLPPRLGLPLWSNFFFQFYFNVMGVLPAWLSEHHVHVCAHKDQMKAMGPPGMELKMFLNHQVGAGNWT